MPPAKRTLVVGATPNPSRFAFIATKMLLEYKHEVLLFGIKSGSIAGIDIAHDWPTESDVDTITLYLSAKWQAPYYQYIIDTAPRRVIFNPGTENPELVSLLESNNIEALEACTLVLLQTNQY